MNFLTKLATENIENYNQYLDRMTVSTEVSTKKNIPFYVKGDKILDVGCGSGVMLEKLRELYGKKEIVIPYTPKDDNCTVRIRFDKISGYTPLVYIIKVY